MVDILPFKGMLYNPDRVKDISAVISPPYDLISADLKKKLKKLSPYNISNLTLPESSKGKDKYLHAFQLLGEWIENEILVFDKQKCFYLVEEIFTEGNEQKSIKGFIGLSKIEEYDSGKVLRHENTLPKPKEDRLKLLEATKTNFGLIYTIYRDHTGLISDIMAEQEPDIAVRPAYDPGLLFKLWKISRPSKLEQIIVLMKGKPVLIADGHHRYETSRIYSSKKEGDLRQNYVLTLFVNSNQKHISIYPTFRLIRFTNSFNKANLLKSVQKYFQIIRLQEDITSLRSMLAREKHKSFIMYLGAKQIFLIRLKNEFLKNNIWEDLDINILHDLLIGNIIGSSNIAEISFTHLENELKQNIICGSYDLGILLNAPPIEQVESLSRQGRLMPQKSTYFYPKPCTGLVMYKFNS